jgi:acetyltransferase-like isoleucine patch superfamily enzyme
MPKSHGTGKFSLDQFLKIGTDVIIENETLVFHPETIEIGDHVYIGHQTILKGYYQGKMQIGDGTWIGQQCFLHSAGTITIGKNVGIAPGVKIMTSYHSEEGIQTPILHSKLIFKPVIIEDDVDIGIGAIILPGVTIGKGTQIGAGAVVNKTIKPYSVAVGVPAKIIKTRI